MSFSHLLASSSSSQPFFSSSFPPDTSVSVQVILSPSWRQGPSLRRRAGAQLAPWCPCLARAPGVVRVEELARRRRRTGLQLPLEMGLFQERPWREKRGPDSWTSSCPVWVLRLAWATCGGSLTSATRTEEVSFSSTVCLCHVRTQMETVAMNPFRVHLDIFFTS